MTATTVQYSRMTRLQALEALRLLRTQLTIHRGMCLACVQARKAKAMRATSWATWTPCDTQRSLMHTKYQLEHRLSYLKRLAVAAAAREAGLTVGVFMRQHGAAYRAIGREFELGEPE